VTAFGSVYASVYDSLYGAKHYAAECDLIETLVERYGRKNGTRILDLGCGTGNHGLRLARRGYEVVGVDRSASMIRRARAKAVARRARGIRFRHGDLRTTPLGEQFDVALMMFAVLGFQLTDKDVKAALDAVRRHLPPGGLLIFDIWYGPAVLAQRPSDRVKVVRRKGERIIRITSGELDELQHRCTVRYQLWHLKGKRLAAEARETQTLRYFFEEELRTFLAASGFVLLRLGAFPNFEDDPSEKSWNVLGVASAA
jgi:SAM-dependent methyltransferase